LWPYIIAYEVEDLDYCSEAICAILRDMGALQLTGTSWLITCDWNANAILEQLQPILGSNDRLIVVEVGEDLAALNISGQHPIFRSTLGSARVPTLKM
jgi:hypothetical protein